MAASFDAVHLAAAEFVVGGRARKIPADPVKSPNLKRDHRTDRTVGTVLYDS